MVDRVRFVDIVFVGTGRYRGDDEQPSTSTTSSSIDLSLEDQPLIVRQSIDPD